MTPTAFQGADRAFGHGSEHGLEFVEGIGGHVGAVGRQERERRASLFDHACRLVGRQVVGLSPLNWIALS